MEMMQQQQRSSVPYLLGHNLPHIVTPETITKHLNTEMVQRLLPLLPEHLQNESELHHTLRSPQLQQAMQTLGYAIESGQMPDIIRTLGLEGAERFISTSSNQQASKDKK